MHKKYNIIPDLAIFGKALGNGYAINAIIGKKSVMDYSKSTFIVLFDREDRPTAALETLKVMEEEKSWKKITKLGKSIKQKWSKISKINKVKIKIQVLMHQILFVQKKTYFIRLL